MTNNPKRWWLAGCAILWLYAPAAIAQSTLMPSECSGKSGAQLDQCVRNMTQSNNIGGAFQPAEQKADPSRLLNCVMVDRADEGFCIARNEIIIECRNHAKNPDFDACVKNLIEGPQLPRAANCTRVAADQRDRCNLRNKVFNACLADPWLYFVCLGAKLNAK
jgi:hypothetical protein